MQLALFKPGRGDEERLVARYRVLREASRQVHARLTKVISKGALFKCARRLGIPFEDNTLVLEAEGELHVLYDYCIYDYREPPGKGQRLTAVERLLRMSPPPEGSDELIVLRASAAARYCIVVGKEVVPGVGVEVWDVLRKQSFFLTDVGLSESAVVGWPLAARIISPEGIHMTTGAALPLPDRDTALDVIAGLEEELGDRLLGGADALTLAEKACLSATIIHAALAHDAASKIAYV